MSRYLWLLSDHVGGAPHVMLGSVASIEPVM